MASTSGVGGSDQAMLSQMQALQSQQEKFTLAMQIQSIKHQTLMSIINAISR